MMLENDFSFKNPKNCEQISYKTFWGIFLDFKHEASKCTEQDEFAIKLVFAFKALHKEMHFPADDE